MNPKSCLLLFSVPKNPTDQHQMPQYTDGHRVEMWCIDVRLPQRRRRRRRRRRSRSHFCIIKSFVFFGSLFHHTLTHTHTKSPAHDLPPTASSSLCTMISFFFFSILHFLPPPSFVSPVRVHPFTFVFFFFFVRHSSVRWCVRKNHVSKFIEISVCASRFRFTRPYFSTTSGNGNCWARRTHSHTPMHGPRSAAHIEYEAQKQRGTVKTNVSDATNDRRKMKNTRDRQTLIRSHRSRIAKR